MTRFLRPILALLTLGGVLFAIFAVRTAERTSRQRSAWDRDYGRFEQNVPYGDGKTRR